jgi:hypothetical protein
MWPRYIRESLEMAEEVVHVRIRHLLGGYRDVKPGMKEGRSPVRAGCLSDCLP